MKQEILFEMKSLYRDDMRIRGYRFGEGEKTVAVVGGIRGNELQQVYACAQLVHRLQQLEQQGSLTPGHSILVVPSINPYSINIEKRFWPTDNTDINRMFPGYDQGETTQRVAAGLFQAIQGYRYGIHFTSNYIPGSFVPHVRMMKTGWEDVEAAMDFGLPYVSLRDPRPYDTTTLNYNWQVWETKAFSLFTSHDGGIDKPAAMEAVTAVLNFMHNRGILHFHSHKGYISSVIEESELISVKSAVAGIFDPTVEVNQQVCRGDQLAYILDPGDGSVRTEITAPADGTVFFIQSNPLAYANAALVKLIP